MSDRKLIEAFEIYTQEQEKNLPAQSGLEHITFSDKFERRIRRLIFMHKNRTALRFIALAAAVLILAIGVFVL